MRKKIQKKKRKFRNTMTRTMNRSMTWCDILMLMIVKMTNNNQKRRFFRSIYIVATRYFYKRTICLKNNLVVLMNLLKKFERQIDLFITRRAFNVAWHDVIYIHIYIAQFVIMQISQTRQKTRARKNIIQNVKIAHELLSFTFCQMFSKRTSFKKCLIFMIEKISETKKTIVKIFSDMIIKLLIYKCRDDRHQLLRRKN